MSTHFSGLGSAIKSIQVASNGNVANNTATIITINPVNTAKTILIPTTFIIGNNTAFTTSSYTLTNSTTVTVQQSSGQGAVSMSCYVVEFA